MPNHAAAVSTVSRRSTRAQALFFALIGLALPTVAAHADSGIDLNDRPDPEFKEYCPALTEIKYPFLQCTDGNLWSVDSDATWENSRRIPRMSDWTESDGHWGPHQNMD